MSYIVLARKWRPKAFKDVVGQEHITTTLLNSMRSSRTAHAYLFVGPRGIGKTSTARIFAKALNCPESSDGEPCGECAACREIAEARSIDVIEIDGASNNSVEDVRMLRENVRIAPAYLRFKVYIIDEVHMLSTAAFNAFLKTLEEPPAHVKFIMATTEAHKIPMTVLSRCQRFDFRRITSRRIFARLKEITTAETIRIDDRALFAIARAAEGSMRDALSILDQLVSFSEAEITLSDVYAMLGTVGIEVYQQVAVAICEGDTFFLLKTVNDIVERGKDLAQFLKDLTLYFRNLLVASLGGGVELIDLPEEDFSALKDVAGRFKPADLIRIVQDLSELETRFRQVPSTRVALETLLMRMAHVGAEISIDNLLSKLTALEKKLKGSFASKTAVSENKQEEAAPPDSAPPAAESSIVAPSPPTSVKEPPSRYKTARGHKGDHKEEPPESAAPKGDPPRQNLPEEPETEPEEESAPPPAEDDKPQLTLWRQLLDEVREQSMSTYSFLSSGRFCGVENEQVIICFDAKSRYNKTHLERKEIKMLLEEILKTIVGAPLKIKLILESDEANMPPPPAPKEMIPDGLRPTRAEEATKERKEKALNNPIVKKVIDLFKGKPVYVSG
ncbi:DNA polymerase III subunit gamma/tau [Candidatus Poribacteria bacterium]|nr:DNA polymerase III subunit gamma/tau [Candidatus Poribacteria bacterium]